MEYLKSSLMVAGSVLLSGFFAEANVCDPRWWEQNPPGFAVEASIQRTGIDVKSPCPNSRDGDYPAHFAAVYSNDPSAVRALRDAGAVFTARNAANEMATDLFQRRYETFVTNFGGSTPLWEALLDAFNSGVENQSAAHRLLCDPDFYPNSSEEAVMNARRQGADPDRDCGDGNKPIHIALGLGVTPRLMPENVAYAIGYGLIGHNRPHQGVTLDARAIELAEIRYQTMLVWWEQMLHRAYDVENRLRSEGWSEEAIARLTNEDITRIKDEYVEQESPKKIMEHAIYMIIKSEAGIESSNAVHTRTNNDIVTRIDSVAEQYGFSRNR